VHELVGLKVLLPDEDMRVLGEVIGVVTRDELTSMPMLGQELIEVLYTHTHMYLHVLSAL
jgi:hypothetical protein